MADYNHQQSFPPPPPAHYSQAHSPIHHYPQEEQYFPPEQHEQQVQHQQPQQPQKRPTHQRGKSSAFSFHSDKSQNQEKTKESLHETHAQKEANRLHSKADPTLAMQEAEPSTIATMAEQSLAPLRSVQHRDSHGQAITDPDRSNPTRSRWERPLDTIRSFEAAIDGGYNRKSVARGDSSEANWNRRSSFQPAGTPQFRPNSYYNSRPQSYQAFHDPRGGNTARTSVYGSQGQDGYHHGGESSVRRPNRSSRMYTDPALYQQQGREQNGYHLNHKDRSYETVTSAAASGNSDQVGYQTDPTSSDNSSIERNSPARRQEPVNEHGIGVNGSRPYHNPEFSAGYGQSQGSHPLPPPPVQGRQPGMPPAVTRKEAPTLLKRQPTQQAQQVQPQAPVSEKRKSWFSRRFSKN